MLLFSGCGQRAKEPSAMTVPPGIVPDQIIEGFSLVETESGRKQWTLTSQKASNYEQQKTVNIEGVKIDFFHQNEELYSTLTSDRGVMNTVSNDMIAQGHVVVVSKDGSRLETNQLRWDNLRQKIVSDDSVRITRGKTVMTGIGLESDPSLEHVVIKEKFKAHAVPEKKGTKGGP
jgi:LPS export ABC transporter protein LptC